MHATCCPPLNHREIYIRHDDFRRPLKLFGTDVAAHTVVLYSTEPFSHCSACTSQTMSQTENPGTKQIDDLRRERVLFDAIYKKMERELSDRKKMMANVIEVG